MVISAHHSSGLSGGSEGKESDEGKEGEKSKDHAHDEGGRTDEGIREEGGESSLNAERCESPSSLLYALPLDSRLCCKTSHNCGMKVK